MSEYYDNITETNEALTPDEWFKTEDIGEWDKNGHLKIIDRKKNLVKTMNGEYIALEKLESVYRAAAIAANICVYASITETHPVAIIVPVEPALKKLAESLGKLVTATTKLNRKAIFERYEKDIYVAYGNGNGK
ncbi:hypothetical protein sscle_05g042730 [Sclerotinia sclerotiorum 1980 UF-70]|uniref:Uncharacterized protein n=1 Tax=Sclerotinia sclerotiorum (strain ATCC 18683 / 1980 / Ss-1) TaxID=665079 RepID=A0A1D9Q4K8_SCLS1|nr:hypothetical protein sscle_05g042730 [Sclerotinia sclerotiorum 1980 UF-70]